MNEAAKGFDFWEWMVFENGAGVNFQGSAVSDFVILVFTYFFHSNPFLPTDFTKPNWQNLGDFAYTSVPNFDSSVFADMVKTLQHEICQIGGQGN